MKDPMSKADERRSLVTEVWLPADLEVVFDFFSRPERLGEITPDWLEFALLTPTPVRMDLDATIECSIRLHGIPIRWRSRIEVWEPPFRFVDVQERGPYAHWRHTHTFTPSNGGTVCRDEIEYAHFGGALVNRLFVRPELEKIFGYRQRVVRERFAGASPSPPAPPTTGHAWPARARHAADHPAR